MQGAQQTKRGRGKRVEINPRGFLVPPADREMYPFVEGVPEDTI